MTVFVDTSAFYAVLDRDDANHAKARERWDLLLSGEAQLITSNYVVVESCALLQNRRGMDAVRLFQDDVLPAIEIRWIDARQHALAMASLLAAGRRKLSLVDCASFVQMRAGGVRDAFAFDSHFTEQGFKDACR
jgi:predicted nucleic acid-binding protein